MNAKYSSNNKTVPVQRATFNKKNSDRSFPTTNYYKQTTAEIGNIQQLESMKCYNCGIGGDVARNCPTADDRLKIPSTHIAYIHVRPNKPFSVINQEGDDYEVTSLKNTPCVTNGIINPQRDLEVEVANFTERTIMIHPGQALAYMKRLNQIQLNLINQKDLTSNNSKQSIKTTETDLAETDLNDIQKQKLSDLIQAFPDVFNEKTGQTSKVKNVIRLLPGSRPCNLPSYRIAP
ncbi:unnamed protein product, partial [Rotaria sordida]